MDVQRAGKGKRSKRRSNVRHITITINRRTTPRKKTTKRRTPKKKTTRRKTPTRASSRYVYYPNDLINYILPSARLYVTPKRTPRRTTALNTATSPSPRIYNNSAYCPANKSSYDCGKYKHCKWTGVNCVTDTDYVKKRADKGKFVYTKAGGKHGKRSTSARRSSARRSKKRRSTKRRTTKRRTGRK